MKETRIHGGFPRGLCVAAAVQTEIESGGPMDLEVEGLMDRERRSFQGFWMSAFVALAVLAAVAPLAVALGAIGAFLWVFLAIVGAVVVSTFATSYKANHEAVLRTVLTRAASRP
jgi:hypothetical protein